MNIVCLTALKDNHRNATNGARVARALVRIGHRAVAIEHGRVSRRDVDWADLILAFGTILYPEHIAEARRVAAMKGGKPFALWYFDACNPEFAHCRGKFNRMLRALPCLDWLFTTDASHDWARHGVRYLHLMQGVDPDDFRWTPAPPEPRRHDLIFTGGFQGWFASRQGVINVLSARYKTAVYGRNSPSRVYGKAFFDAYQKARVAFVPKPPAECPGPYWSNRVYLAAATGTPCVVGYSPGIERHFEDEREVLFFRDRAGLFAAIDRLLHSPELRGRLGAAARERVLREHTYDARARALIQAVFA